jgi:uncharacterized membrane protein YtjA (UPF0391 family)
MQWSDRRPLYWTGHTEITHLGTGTGCKFFLLPAWPPLESHCVSTTSQVVTKLQLSSLEADRRTRSSRTERRTKMLYYALVFLLIAILAAVFGFGGVAIVSAGIAKILFFVFIVLFLVSLITHMSRRV